MKTRFNPLFLLSLWLFCMQAYNQEIQDMPAMFDRVMPELNARDTGIMKDFDFFASDDLLQMTLAFDTREFIKSKFNPEYMDAVLTVKISETDSITQSIRLKARGEFRRTYCSFPPIMLKFKESDHDSGRVIQSKGTLKLVTHCNATSKFENTLLKEYLAYRMFNLVTPYSFRTRLVRVNYKDVNKAERSQTTYAFLIENEDQMAARNNAVIIDTKNVTQKHMIPSDMIRIAVYNYMIGNTDWSVPLQHNIKVLKSLTAPSDLAIPVAYDFDYSGFVDALYAVPHEQLPIKDVAERYYLGVCDRDEELNNVIDEFNVLQDKFMDTINNFEYLAKNHKKSVESYIDSFYKTTGHKNYLITDLNRTCKSF